MVELLCSVKALAHKEHKSWERPSHQIKKMPCSPDIAVELTRHCSGFSVQTIQLHVINQLPVQGMKPCRGKPSYIPMRWSVIMVSHHFPNTCSSPGVHWGGNKTCAISLILRPVFYAFSTIIWLLWRTLVFIYLFVCLLLPKSIFTLPKF